MDDLIRELRRLAHAPTIAPSSVYANACEKAYREIERLQTTLQTIVTLDRWNNKPYTGNDVWSYGDCAKAARTALGTDDESTPSSQSQSSSSGADG